MENMIEIQNLNKTYKLKDAEPTVAVDNMCLTIGKGEFLAIEGVSGSGKSTLLNMIGTLDVPTAGSIRIADNEITKMSARKLAIFRNEFIGFVLQDFALIPYNTGYENIEVPLLFTKKKLNRREAIYEAAEKVGITKLLKQRVNTMSGGQKQRVAIARALVNQPQIILADEPTGALDSKTKKDIVDLLRHIADEGKTVVMVTHDEKAASVADRIITISDGRIVAEK
ncbi:MAG: ABC transporter ATP-binding protein [Clostridiales bacterium]|nr:ABC transporter ATP-binding protein [Clostridiales bacterium]